MRNAAAAPGGYRGHRVKSSRRGKSGMVAAIAGAATVLVIALFCMYAEAFSWATSRGTLLDLSLTPVAYPTPMVSWTFVLAEGLACASCAIWLVGDTVAACRRARLKSAIATGAIILLLAILSQITTPAGWPLDALPLWQRGGHFIATSSAFVMFTAFLFMWSLSKTPSRSPSTESAEEHLLVRE